MPPPLPRCSGWAYSSLISPRRVSLPRKGRRVGLHIAIFEICSAFTRVAACTLAQSPNRDTLIEGFSHFVTSMTAPIASGWSESPGGACTHWKAPPCHGAHPLRTFGPADEIETPPTPGFPKRGYAALIKRGRKQLHELRCGPTPREVRGGRTKVIHVAASRARHDRSELDPVCVASPGTAAGSSHRSSRGHRRSRDVAGFSRRVT